MMELMKISYSLGIIGGRNGNALYFTGVIDDKYLIYLDPHTCQEITASEIDSYFCKQFNYIETSKIGSTLAFGFYLEDLN